MIVRAEDFFKKGDRVTVHPDALAWLRGPTYGTVLSVSGKYPYSPIIIVELDRSKKVRGYEVRQVRFVGRPGGWGNDDEELEDDDQDVVEDDYY